MIVSGGDPLTLPLGKLRFFLDNLTAIDARRRDPHRHPRAGHAAAAALRPRTDRPAGVGREGLDPDALQPPARDHPGGGPRLQGAAPGRHADQQPRGAAEGRQRRPRRRCATLLRGLLRIKVRPYYLFHCDPVTGAGHFRTTVWKGLEIMEGLRGHMSGLGIPTYVVDSPHGGGKIPLMPNYLVSPVRRRGRPAQLRGDARSATRRRTSRPRPSRPTTRGVSGLLQGDKTALMPEGNERMARRRKLQRARPTAAAATAAARPSSDGDGTAAADHPAADAERQRQRARRERVTRRDTMSR